MVKWKTCSWAQKKLKSTAAVFVSVEEMVQTNEPMLAGVGVTKNVSFASQKEKENHFDEEKEVV